MNKAQQAVAEHESNDLRRRWVAATSALVLLVASVFSGVLALFGVDAVRAFEYDHVSRDPYLEAAAFTMAPVTAILFAGALAWHAVTLRPVWKWRLVIVATIVTASILYLAAHNPAPTSFDMS